MCIRDSDSCAHRPRPTLLHPGTRPTGVVLSLIHIYNQPIFRVYEEPESHLSPVGQLGIIQLIAMLANRNPDNQIIIPTHTPYLLYEINNIV